jgi:hypothetical protein
MTQPPSPRHTASKREVKCQFAGRGTNKMECASRSPFLVFFIGVSLFRDHAVDGYRNGDRGPWAGRTCCKKIASWMLAHQCHGTRG